MPHEVEHHDQIEAQVGHHQDQDWDVEVDHPPSASFLDNGLFCVRSSRSHSVHSSVFPVQVWLRVSLVFLRFFLTLSLSSLTLFGRTDGA